MRDVSEGPWRGHRIGHYRLTQCSLARAATVPFRPILRRGGTLGPDGSEGRMSEDWRTRPCLCMLCQYNRLVARYPSLTEEAAGVYVVTRTFTSEWPKM